MTSRRRILSLKGLTTLVVVGSVLVAAPLGAQTPIPSFGNGKPAAAASLGTPYFEPPQQQRGMTAGGSRSGDGGTIALNSSMLRGVVPNIPNLQWGYVLTVSEVQTQGRLLVDYMKPFRLSDKDLFFVETHGRFENLFKTLAGAKDKQIQFLAGGGYRRRLGNVMFGLSAFYNTARLYGTWYASGLSNLEMAAVLPGNGIGEASFAYFGNLFSGTTGIFHDFREGRGDYKADLAYSQPVLDDQWILRLKGSAYQFFRLGHVRGLSMTGDVRSKNGMYRLEYTAGKDQLSGRYHSLGAYLTVGFSFQELFARKNPFSVL
jgi:hypothetical protein